ncbi:MAG: hypothetical protein K2M29_05730, partial [Paramuribaculum sp.]|nr:hypothetical protein [Paramuribaculum sp.]
MASKTSHHTLLDDYLTALGVPHTASYSEDRIRNLPFKTMFGLSKLLDEYGIKSEGYLLEDKNELEKLTPPFLANTSEGEVIVTSIEGDNISYISLGESETAPLSEFRRAWDGKVLLSFP